MRWPKGISAPLVGTQSAYQWAFWDFLATAADLAGSASVPQNDGVSIKPLFESGSMAPKPFVYHEYCAPNEYSILGWGQAVRMADMVGLCVGPQPYTAQNVPVCLNSTGFWLYNLTQDIGQNRNIAMDKGNSELVEQMVGVMHNEHVQGHYCGNA